MHLQMSLVDCSYRDILSDPGQWDENKPTKSSHNNPVLVATGQCSLKLDQRYPPCDQ